MGRVDPDSFVALLIPTVSTYLLIKKNFCDFLKILKKCNLNPLPLQLRRREE